MSNTSAIALINRNGVANVSGLCYRYGTPHQCGFAILDQFASAPCSTQPSENRNRTEFGMSALGTPDSFSMAHPDVYTMHLFNPVPRYESPVESSLQSFLHDFDFNKFLLYVSDGIFVDKDEYKCTKTRIEELRQSPIFDQQKASTIKSELTKAECGLKDAAKNLQSIRHMTINSKAKVEDQRRKLDSSFQRMLIKIEIDRNAWRQQKRGEIQYLKDAIQKLYKRLQECENELNNGTESWERMIAHKRVDMDGVRAKGSEHARILQDAINKTDEGIAKMVRFGERLSELTNVMLGMGGVHNYNHYHHF